MAIPIKENETKTMTYEQLLMGRLTRAFEAMDFGDGLAFDDIVEGLEMLLKLRPELFQELMEYKQGLVQEVQQVLEQARMFASQARNQIQQRIIYDSEVDSIEWDARKDYFDKIIEIMGNNNLIAMQMTEPSTIEEFNEPVIQQPPQQQFQQPMQPQQMNVPQQQENQKKPKLSIRKKDDKRFDV